MIKILGFLEGRSGCDWYRCEQPLLQMRMRKEADVRLFRKNESVGWFEFGDTAKRLNAMFEWADIIFVPRLSHGKLIKVMEEFKKLGKKIVTDWDDNIFKVSPFAMQYRDFGTEEFSYKCDDGSTIEVWKDGDKGFDVARNKQVRGSITQGISYSDMFLVTTEDLREVYKPFHSKIEVCPNSVDVNLWKRFPFKPHTGLRMGWFGGDNHYEDWLMIAPMLREFMKTHPRVTLVILGQKFDGTLKDIDPRQIEHHESCHIDAYPLKAASLDIDFAVIPLVDNDFNNGKSPVKWLEMAALEVPAVTSHVKPYTAMNDLVKDNGIFIENNDLQSWYEGLCAMHDDTWLRKRMGLAAYETVRRHYDANVTWKFWLQAFEKCMKGEVQSPPQFSPQLSVL